jgi:prolipoprotein diacylglyceryltransferase
MDFSPAYATFMLLAAGVFFLARRCLPDPAAARLAPAERRGIALGGFLGGVLGAKLPFVLEPGESWLTGAWLADGKTVTTGLIGAYLGVELAKRLLGVRAGTGDAFALPLALALAVGRWGCFFHGCCAGCPTALPWAADFGDGVGRHPTQVYESAFHLTMAGVLLVLDRRGLLPGNRLKLYLAAYAAFRFAVELVRAEPAYALGLTYYQWVAAAGAAGLLAQWAGIQRTSTR